MDELAESFGESFGPHFWLTFDDVSAERMQYVTHESHTHLAVMSGGGV
jgi:hypothetical protein